MQTLTVKRGDTLRATLTFKQGTASANLNGCQARMQARTTTGQVVLDLSSSTDDLTVDGAAGKVILSADNALAVGTYMADVELTYAGGAVKSSDTFMIQVTPDVTKDDAP